MLWTVSVRHFSARSYSRFHCRFEIWRRYVGLPTKKGFFAAGTCPMMLSAFFRQGYILVRHTTIESIFLGARSGTHDQFGSTDCTELVHIFGMIVSMLSSRRAIDLARKRMSLDSGSERLLTSDRLRQSRGAPPMPTRAVEEAHLFKARHHVANAQARIADQLIIVARLRADGLDTRRAEASLRLMQETLRLMNAYKELIEDMLAQDDAATIARAAIHSSLVRSMRIDRTASRVVKSPGRPSH